MTGNVGCDEGAERDNDEVLRARILEAGMRHHVGDAPVPVSRRNFSVDEVDLPGSAPVLEYGALPVQPRVKLMRADVVFDDDIVRLWSRDSSSKLPSFSSARWRARVGLFPVDEQKPAGRCELRLAWSGQDLEL